SGRDARGEVLSWGVQPGQYWGVDPAAAQLKRLVDATHAQRTSSGLQRRKRDVDRTVAVPVGLDHGHGGSPGLRSTPSQDADVVPDRGEIDHHFGSGTGPWH